MTGEMIARARQTMDCYGDRPAVDVTFNEEGARRFGEATREHVGQPVAVVLDDVVLTTPRIDEPILGGTVRIGGNFTLESARQLAAWLGSGALPVRLVVVGSGRRPWH